MAYLPNKKILIFIALILIIFAGWFYYSKQKNKQSEYLAGQQDSGPLTVIAGGENQLDSDTDGDGLKDWEESLWRTDPKNPDTDDDGATDGEETTQNRDPLKQGPDDKISANIDDVVLKNQKQAESEQTITAGYAKKFLTSYLLLKQAKGELTTEDKNKLVSDFMSDIQPLKVEDKYKLSDLKITQDDSKETIEKYAEEMKKVLVSEGYFLADDLEVFENLLKIIKDNRDQNEFDRYVYLLNYSSQKYDEVVKKLTHTSFFIPPSVVNFHKEVINGLNNLVISIKMMAIVKNDPIKAIMGKTLYIEQLKRTFNALNEIQKIFDDYNISVFKQ